MRSPVGETINLDTLADDPCPLISRLRAEEPVAWAPQLDRWLVSRRDLVIEVVSDTERFTTDHRRSPIRDTFGSQMLSTDGVEQRLHRRPFAPPFQPAALRERATESVARRARDLVEQISPGDDLTSVASTMAVQTVLDILQIDDIGDVPTVIDWYDDLAAGLANVLADEKVAVAGCRAAAEFREALAGTAADQPEGPETANNALVILFGGIETTQSALLNALWALAGHPDAQAAARREKAVLHNAIEESLRWEPAVMTLTRFTLADTQLAGRTIPADSGIECLIAGANRDPARFDDPDLFDISRTNAGDHFTFGYGRHHCLGAHLARLEIAAFTEALFERSPDGFGFADADQPNPRGHEFRRPPTLRLDW